MNDSINSFPRAGFMRRIAAMVYDLLVAVAVGMCAAIVMTVVFTLLYENGVLDKGGIEHVGDVMQQSLLYQTSMQIWVSLWVAGFFVWFWRNGGQTIGMRAWRLRIVSTNEQPMNYGRAILRLFTSLLGLGTLLVLVDFKNKLALQDRLTQTEMIALTKDANHHRNWRGLD
ncbi:RDD family protein [Alteromonadaceae bacterium BrNp21-10]|nr:RDD family protein [Alteromonadaceae bacterium BrNp21-10]